MTPSAAFDVAFALATPVPKFNAKQEAAPKNDFADLLGDTPKDASAPVKVKEAAPSEKPAPDTQAKVPEKATSELAEVQGDAPAPEAVEELMASLFLVATQPVVVAPVQAEGQAVQMDAAAPAPVLPATPKELQALMQSMAEKLQTVADETPQALPQAVRQGIETLKQLPETVQAALPPAFKQLLENFVQATSAPAAPASAPMATQALPQVPFMPETAMDKPEVPLAAALQVAPAVPVVKADAQPVQAPKVEQAPDAPQAAVAPMPSDGAGDDAQTASHDGGDGTQDALPTPIFSPLHAKTEQAGPSNAPSFGAVLQQAMPDTSPAEQAMAHIRAMTRAGESRIQIQLAPVELGSLEIRLDVAADGQTKLHIAAENPRTLDILRSDARQLENMLRDVGLKPDPGSLSFSLRDERQPGSNQQQQSGSQQQRPQAGTVNALEEIPAHVASRAYTLASAEGLDMTI